MAASGSLRGSIGARGYSTREPTGRSISSTRSPLKTARGALRFSMVTTRGWSLREGRGRADSDVTGGWPGVDDSDGPFGAGPGACSGAIAWAGAPPDGDAGEDGSVMGS